MNRIRHGALPWKDKDGQEWVLRIEVARRMKITYAKVLYAERRQWIQGKKKRGQLWFPWPQVQDEIKMNAAHTMETADNSNPDEPPSDLPEILTTNRGRGNPPGAAASANATKTKIAAELLRLEYESKLGRLVPYEEVRRIWENAAETLKKSLLSIPDRIAPEFGGKNSHRLYRALVTEINHVLENMKIKHEYGKDADKRRAGRPLGR